MFHHHTKQKILDLIEGTAVKSAWLDIGLCHHYGIALPISALKSSTSCGIGEYLDLLKVIDFCKEVGFDVIQLLPVNDSSFDPSPYNAMSSLALHPIYLSLSQLEKLDLCNELKQELDLFAPYLKQTYIPYQEVLYHKLKWLRSYYEKIYPLYKDDSQYLDFLKERPWIQGYALYKTLREEVFHHIWKEWPEDVKNPSDAKIQSLIETYQESVSFYSFLQYLCHMQLKSVKDYAAKSQVFLKGDIPILISPDSADMWLYRSYFDIHHTVGTPPDAFNHEGQHWGFPAFNWNAIRADDFSWWKTRLQVSSEYYHLYRLDHTVGFYRLWLIPPGGKPRDGHFKPDHLPDALHLGHEILTKLMSFSSMLPIAEDLGLIPHDVFHSLRSMGIPGTKVLRWERDYNHDENKFYYHAYHHYHPLNMTCVSTHDSNTLQGWWEEFPKEAQDFCTFKEWEYSQVLTEEHRYGILYDSIHTPTLFHINLFQEYMGLCEELIHKDPALERINIPGFLLPTNWTYRFLPTIEELLVHEALKTKLKKLISSRPKELG